MSTGGAIMPAARAVAAEATAQYPGMAVQLASGDPLDALIDRVRPQAGRSVDALQVAAALETAGMTDHAARARFGFADVFDLAEAVHRRVPPVPEPEPSPPARARSGDWRDISHGAMYLMAAAIFPPAVAALGGSASVTAIVLAAAVGWVLSGVISWLAYRLLGEGHPGSADHLLRWAALSAVPLGGVVGGGVAALTGGGLAVIAVTATAMAYQLAVTVLVIHGQEALVFAAMAPAVAGGVAFVLVGPSMLVLSVSAGLGSVAVAFGLALYETFGRAAAPAQVRKTIRRNKRRLLLVFAFTALSAVFFLRPQALHLATRLDIALAALPLIAGMGVVEWRARRFADQARTLLARVTHPRQFALRVWLVVLGGLGVCLAVVSGLAAPLLGVLSLTGHDLAPAAAMAAAGVLLSGAYYLGFLLANLGRYVWLCTSLLLSLGAYEVARLALPGVLGDTLAFQIAAALLLVLYTVGLVGFLTEAHRHR